MQMEQIFTAAAQEGQKRSVAYAGVVTPAQAFALQEAGAAVIVDVRTSAEWAYVGRVPDAKEIEWQSFPDMSVNENFIPQLRDLVPTETPVLFICRSGVRSHHAATVAVAAGYRAYNVLEGFEGDLDAKRQRNSVNGWRQRGLPWIQS